MHVFETNYQLSENEKHIEKVGVINSNQMINIQLKQGQKISEHHAKEHVIIIVRRGNVLFTIEGQEVELTNEKILVMNPLENHDLIALEDTDLILIKVK